MENTMNTLHEFLVTYGIRLIGALLIFFIGKWAACIISKIIEKVMAKSKTDSMLCSFVRSLTYMALLIFVIIAALNKLGIETTSFVAIIGAAGLAIGFALQGSLSNFAAGVMLVVFKPFRVGEFIEAAGTMGTVEEIQIFNTILRSPDNKRIIVPNASITGGLVTNCTGIEKRRIDMVFGVSYTDDLKKAKDILLRLVSSDNRVLNDPVPLVAVSELGESSVNLVCRPWVKPADYWDVYFDTLEKGKSELEKAGITIPFPQRDIHLHQAKNS
ncbi:mechanosensitive ion channel [bacterium]|nr:mechanosensitive ion channel [bacterium]MCP5461699.1 mechanosensitive ion channel [bacterium]